MRIIAVTKSLNEERNIERFCLGYAWADAVLVGDGGSEDATVELAQQFVNTQVREFTERLPIADGFMNPEPAHLNFIIDWAIVEEADWIILDGTDCWPNKALQKAARKILESTDRPAIHLHRLYLWGTEHYFPKYNVSHALWAWRPAVIDIRSAAGLTSFEAPMVGIDPDRALLLDPPLVCLHHCFPDEAEVQRKMARYAMWGHPMVHPLASIYAPPEPLPEWARDE